MKKPEPTPTPATPPLSGEEVPYTWDDIPNGMGTEKKTEFSSGPISQDDTACADMF